MNATRENIREHSRMLNISWTLALYTTKLKSESLWIEYIRRYSSVIIVGAPIDLLRISNQNMMMIPRFSNAVQRTCLHPRGMTMDAPPHWYRNTGCPGTCTFRLLACEPVAIKSVYVTPCGARHIIWKAHATSV
jgi:hypothetical protein